MTLLSLWINIFKCFNPRFHLCSYDILCASFFFFQDHVSQGYTDRVGPPSEQPEASSGARLRSRPP